MDKLVIYTGNFLFPDGNAAGKRILGNIRAIQAAGYSAACICFRNDRMDEGLLVREVEGVYVCSIPYTRGIKRVNNMWAKRVFRKAISDLENRYQIHTVIMYGALGTAAYNLDVIRLCRKRGVPVIYDIADLFDQPLKNNYLRYVVKKIDLWLMDHKILPGCDKWIAISTYLRDRMPDPERTVIIPPLAVEVSSAELVDQTRCTTFAYASVINERNIPVSDWKDRIDTIVDAFYLLLQEKKETNFKVHFIGFTLEELIGQFPEDQRSGYREKLLALEGYVVFHGRKTNSEAQQIIRQSDFTILLRDSKTCTNAGFPTKVSESLSLGVPVAVNATGDIMRYVRDGVNGIALPAPDQIEAVADKLQSILALTRAQKDALRENAVSERPFYYGNYVEKFRAFLDF